MQMIFFRRLIAYLATFAMMLSLTSKAQMEFSKADISCDIQLKKSVVNFGYPIEAVLVIQNNSDIQVSIGQVFSTWGPDVLRIKRKTDWEDVQKRFYDQFFLESVPMENLTIPPGQIIEIIAYLTERYKFFEIGKAEIALNASIYIVMPELGYDYPMSAISCHTDATIEISECDPRKRSADLESLMQQILTEQEKERKDKLIKKLVSFTSSDSIDYLKRLWELPGCRNESKIIFSLFSFDHIETDFILVNLSENEFWSNVVTLLSKRDKYWMKMLIEKTHNTENKSTKHILDALKTLSSK